MSLTRISLLKQRNQTVEVCRGLVWIRTTRFGQLNNDQASVLADGVRATPAARTARTDHLDPNAAAHCQLLARLGESL